MRCTGTGGASRIVRSAMPSRRYCAAVALALTPMPSPAALGVIVLANSELTWQIMLYAALAGLLSSGVPYFVDVLALRLVPAHFSGVFMSVQPIVAALVGLLMLGERLDVWSWLAMLVIVAANVVAVTTPKRPNTRPARQSGRRVHP